MNERTLKKTDLRCPYEHTFHGPFEGPWDIDQLTRREKQVLLLLGAGLTNRELGRRLGIAERTVKAHVSRILAKLGQRTRLQAAVISVLDHDRLCPAPG